MPGENCSNSRAMWQKRYYSTFLFHENVFAEVLVLFLPSGYDLGYEISCCT
jgi:hypothetical protein